MKYHDHKSNFPYHLIKFNIKNISDILPIPYDIYIYKNHTIDRYKKKIIKIQSIFSYFLHCADAHSIFLKNNIIPPSRGTYISIEKITPL